MGKESIQSEAPLKERVAADHGRDAAQLKAEHGKEMSALKAEEAQLLAAQKAEHAKTPGKTGLIAKLTGKEDPVKKAEKQELKAEIARAEETTKAAHDAENAQLKAHRTTDMSAVNAADKLHGSHTNHAAGLPAAGALAHGTHGGPAGIPDNKIYNHATGAHGQAALEGNGQHHHHGIAAFADNGLGDRHQHSHHDNNNNGGLNQGNQGGLNQGGLNQGGLNQGFVNQGGFANQGGLNQGMAMPMGAVPVATMPMVQGMAVPLTAQAVPLAGASNVATIAPSHAGTRL